MYERFEIERGRGSVFPPTEIYMMYEYTCRYRGRGQLGTEVDIFLEYYSIKGLL